MNAFSAVLRMDFLRRNAIIIGIIFKEGVSFRMLPQLVLFALTAAAVIVCVVTNASVSFGGRKVSLYWVAALAGALAAVAAGFVSVDEIKLSFFTNTAVNPLKILILFFSMTAISVFLDEAGFYNHLASGVVEMAGTSQLKCFFILFAVVSVLTVFTSNDIIILTFTPFILYFARRTGINPVPYIFGEFVAANTWSMFFIFGNPTNIYISTAFGIDFFDYAYHMIPVTLAAGLASLTVLFLVFRKSLSKPIQVQPMEELQWNRPLSAIGLVFLGLSIVAMAVASYAGFEMWLAAFLFALGCMASAAVYLKKSHGDLGVLGRTMKKLPWALSPFLLSMFVLILSLNQAGITESLAHTLPDSPFAYGLASFAASNVINNIPMSVLFTSILGSSHATSAMVYAVVLGSNLGALLTPVGALAGIMWLSIVKEHSINFSFLTFMKYGEIISIPAVLMALGCLCIL